MKLRNILILAFFNIFLFTLGAQAQQVRISGTVNDDMGPVMMCNVSEIDNNNRIVSNTQTDFNGNFSMTVKNAKNKLQISYVGYQKQILAIGTRTKFNVTLKDVTRIKEVTITSKRKFNQGGLAIPEKEVSVAAQTFNIHLPMRPCRDRLLVWILSQTLVTWVLVLPCVFVVLPLSMVTLTL